MKNRKVIYIVVLILGLALIGGGLGAYYATRPQAAESVIISGNPMITMLVTYNNADAHDSLYVYENRKVLDIQHVDPRPDLGRKGATVYKYAEITKIDLDNLVQLVQNNVDKLNENYQYDKGDMDTVLKINIQGVSKTVTARGYLGPYSNYNDPDSRYAGMPAPLDEICSQLNKLGAQTVEFTPASVS